MIEKKLKDSSGKDEPQYSEPDSHSPTYSYRVRLGDTEESIKLYCDDFYLVKDGYYYKQVNGLPVKTKIRYSEDSFDIPVYGDASDDGIISGIPAGFSVVIRGLVPGTYFTVEEVELPDEYKHVSTVIDSAWKWNKADEKDYNADEVSDTLKEQYKNLEYGVIGKIISGISENKGAHITVTNVFYKSTDEKGGQDNPQNGNESGSDTPQNSSDNSPNGSDGTQNIVGNSGENNKETISGAGSKKQPSTGDVSNIVLWAGILLVSATLIALLFKQKKKRQQR